MTKTRFFKYEGLGNDFILVPQKPCWNHHQIKNYCDRHFGIGADGVIFMYQDDDTLWTMKIFNADGSPAQMCGNGIRCVAQWLLEHAKVVVDQIKTDSGIKTCTRTPDSMWLINMGIADIQGNYVSMGNPHQVFLSPVDRDKINPNLNTEFVKIENQDSISITVFERGAGETLACGTGACACVAYLVNENLLAANREIKVHLKGGKLYITACPAAHGLQLHMKGPAHQIFEGEV